MDNELKEILKYLRLPNLLANWDDYVTEARKSRSSAVRFLTSVLQEEYKAKHENSRKLRLKKAKIPEMLHIETYPFKRQPKLDRKKVMSLYDAFDYMNESRNIIWIGPTGVGKSGLATSFLIQAINRGYTGRYVMFADLVAELFRAEADHSSEKLLKNFLAYDCLFIDELGYIEVHPAQVGQFFTLLQKRHKKKSTLITSNLGFSDWRSFLKNDQLTAALLDRLTENSHVINMKQCKTLRPKLELTEDVYAGDPTV